MTKKETQNKPQVILSHMAINSFIEVSIPEGTKSIAINENYITDFVGLNSLRRLEYLCIDKNPIISFRGFPRCPNLTNLSLIDTPISQRPNFRALAIAVAGQQLKTLNGVEVSSNDRSAALAFGPPETTCQLIIRGWLPKKPVSLPASKSRNSAENNSTIKNRILQLVDEQERDPISVRMTRVLRAQGYGIPQIREFLIDFFSPHTTKKKETKKLKEDSSIEAQIKKQQQIIDVLAAQLHALRSGNRTFNDYDEMIRTSGINLLKNAEILKQFENDENNDTNNDQNNVQNYSQNAFQNSEFSASNTKKKNKPEYELLRSAVIDFLQVSEDTKDDILIQKLDSFNLYCIEEEEAKDFQNTNPQFEQLEYGQQIHQENQELPQNQINYNSNIINDNANANTNNDNTNNEFTEDEIIPRSDDDIIPPPTTKNIIIDMDDKNENDSQIEEIFDEEEDDNERDPNEDIANLNDTVDRGINVPDKNNAPTKDVDEDVKKVLDNLNKFIDEDDSQTDNDSIQPIDNIQSSS